MLNSLAIAIAISPTLWSSGWFAFPAPSSLVLLHCLFDPEFKRNNNELIHKNLGGAVIAFAIFWFISWLLNLILQSKKLQPPGKTKMTAEFLAMLGTASVLLIIVIYYFGFCYAQPPKGMPVYEGP